MTRLEGEGLEWCRKAQMDFDSFNLLKDHENTIEPALFHAQQAIEKWLKGLLVINNIQADKTHNLSKLLALGQQVYSELLDEKYLFYCSTLQQYAVDSRYPGLDLELAELEEDLRVAVNALREISVFVRLRIPSII